MATITSIKVAELAGVSYASISFSNGAGIYARIVRNSDSEMIILYAGKLVAISKPDCKCEVLVEGVSIR